MIFVQTDNDTTPNIKYIFNIVFPYSSFIDISWLNFKLKNKLNGQNYQLSCEKYYELNKAII